MTHQATQPWWKEGVIYQIYPRSFMDSTGDGIGDLEGIRQRLPHLVDLGVDAIWISPIFPSPMKDAGYDVADYCDIDPLFGSLEDFERLSQAVKDAGLKLLLDFVPSHSSDQHPWFLEARQSRDADKRDWYIWRDPLPDGSPPTNWISEFAGSTWTFHPETGQYYLHVFLPEQPALNWRNPELRAAMYDVMRFWFDRGVDGFRVDALENLMPNPDLGDNPPNPDWVESMGPARSHLPVNIKHQPEILAAGRDMRSVANEYDPERLLVGEIYGTTEQLMKYYGDNHDAFQLPFNFLLIEAVWQAEPLAGMIRAYEAALPEGAWPNWVLGNHDRPRIASRIGPWRARLAAMLLLTLRGTPTLYQGDELGMENVPIPPEAVQDPWERNVPGQGLGRDPVRTPIAWETGHGAGFTTGTPWLPVDTRPEVAVETQQVDPDSMLSFHKALLALRKREKALTLGDLTGVNATGEVLHYRRTHQGRTLAVALNLGETAAPCPETGDCLISTHTTTTGDLAPGEGRVLAQ